MFGKHLPGPFSPSGVLRGEGEREAVGRTPDHCLALPHSAPPRITPDSEALKSTGTPRHSPRSQPPPESREEREGEARVRGGSREGGSGLQG